MYPSIHRHEPTLFGHNSFNYNYESQIRKKYINEYMSIKSDNILLNTSKLLNTFNDSYSIQKLKCSVSDNSTCRLKYHNYTRPRHKIFLEGDSLAPINSNNSVDFNYIIDVFNKSYMNSALTSQSPFNFYSTMNLFKKQIDFIDYKSLSKMQKNDKYLFYFNKNLILSKNTHLSFYKYVANTFFNNSNIQHSNVEYGSIALSGNKYNFYKNMKFNKFLFPYFTLFSPTLLNQHTSNPELFLEKTKNILKHITNSYVGIKRTPTFVNKYTYRAEHLVNDKYSLKHKYDAPNIYNINNRRNVKTKYILPDKYLNTKLLTYKNIFQLPDFNQIGAAFDEEYSFLNLIDYY